MRLALVSLASIARWLEKRCVSAPHDGMQRRRRGSCGRRGLVRSGRVVGSREGDSSSTAFGLMAVASANLGGSGHCEWPGIVSGRATRGGKRQNTAVSGHRIRGARLERTLCSVWARWASFSWRSRARRLIGSVTRRRGGSPAHRPSGRDPGTGVTSQRAIGPPNPAGSVFV